MGSRVCFQPSLRKTGVADELNQSISVPLAVFRHWWLFGSTKWELYADRLERRTSLLGFPIWRKQIALTSLSPDCRFFTRPSGWLAPSLIGLQIGAVIWAVSVFYSSKPWSLSLHMRGMRLFVIGVNNFPPHLLDEGATFGDQWAAADLPEVHVVES